MIAERQLREAAARRSETWHYTAEPLAYMGYVPQSQKQAWARHNSTRATGRITLNAATTVGISPEPQPIKLRETELQKLAKRLTLYYRLRNKLRFAIVDNWFLIMTRPSNRETRRSVLGAAMRWVRANYSTRLGVRYA